MGHFYSHFNIIFTSMRGHAMSGVSGLMTGLHVRVVLGLCDWETVVVLSDMRLVLCFGRTALVLAFRIWP